MNIANLIGNIITAVMQVRAKLLKLNDYWTYSHVLTVTASNVASGFSIETPTATVMLPAVKLLPSTCSPTARMLSTTPPAVPASA